MKKRHESHGGSWKVAYADFVTAMMALFLVLWLTAQDTKIKEAVERAFRNPFSAVTKESVGIIPNKEATASQKQAGHQNQRSRRARFPKSIFCCHKRIGWHHPQQRSN